MRPRLRGQQSWQWPRRCRWRLRSRSPPCPPVRDSSADPLEKSLVFSGIHCDDMALFWKGLAGDIGAEFAECGDALRLQAVMLGGEISVNLGVARHVAPVLAQNVLGKQVL